MFSNCQMPGLHFAYPDVCNTLVGTASAPVPYPNLGYTSTAIPTIFNQFTMCTPDHNLLTQTPLSSGDELGILLGVASGLIVGPIWHAYGSSKVFKTIFPATKMLSITGHNGLIPNIVGVTLTPGQPKVMIMC